MLGAERSEAVYAEGTAVVRLTRIIEGRCIK